MGTCTYSKSGQNSKMSASDSGEQFKLDSMYDKAPVGPVPIANRTYRNNNYKKTGSNDAGDVSAALRTETYIFDTYMKSK